MARAPDERITQAYDLYKQGMKLVEIASQLKLPEGTVRRWKSTHKWDGEHSDKKGERSKREKSVQKAQIAKEVNDVLDNTELNDKQRLFCLNYIKCFNATKAYLKAYECDEYSARVNGSRLLTKDSVKAEIYRLKQEKLNQTFLEPSDIFQKYMDIAFADLTDYVRVDDETGETSVRAMNEIDGTIVSEISSTANGVKVKLHDSMRALDWLTAHMNMATDEQKAKLGLMNAQRDKLTGNNQEIEDTSDTDGEIYGSN